MSRPHEAQRLASVAYYDALIVGAGQGGAQVAAQLRQSGFNGTIAIVGDEPELPYERPPLSKDYLSGAKGFERLLIRSPAYWQERDVVVLTGRRVLSVDPQAREVLCDDGSLMRYGRLVWATGGQPRRLTCAGNDLKGVHTLRTRADADRMRAERGTTRRAVVVGGGYIGLESAAVLAKAGKHVTLFEALDRVLARVAGEPLSRFYEAEHRSHGVDVRLGVTVECIEGIAGRVSGVRLSSGLLVPCEMVVVGIGIIPAVEPLLVAGAQGSDGVAVDRQCRTSLPDVFAVGDCALHANVHALPEKVRLESVQNATDQATVVARVIAGHDTAYDAVPWFWSNQYDLKLQTVGLSTGYDDLLIRGSMKDRSFSVVYLSQGKVIALDCVNATRDFVQGKRLIEKRCIVPTALLADDSIQIKDMVEQVTDVPAALAN